MCHCKISASFPNFFFTFTGSQVISSMQRAIYLWEVSDSTAHATDVASDMVVTYVRHDVVGYYPAQMAGDTCLNH